MRQIAAEFLPFQMPGSQTHGLVAALAAAFSGEVATINGPFGCKIDFTPSARPAEVPSSFPYRDRPQLPASRWPLSGPALAVSRAFACPVSRRGDCQPKARHGTHAMRAPERVGKTLPRGGEFSANWRAAIQNEHASSQSHQAITSHSGIETTDPQSMPRDRHRRRGPVVRGRAGDQPSLTLEERRQRFWARERRDFEVWHRLTPRQRRSTYWRQRER